MPSAESPDYSPSVVTGAFCAAPAARRAWSFAAWPMPPIPAPPTLSAPVTGVIPPAAPLPIGAIPPPPAGAEAVGAGAVGAGAVGVAAGSALAASAGSVGWQPPIMVRQTIRAAMRIEHSYPEPDSVIDRPQVVFADCRAAEHRDRGQSPLPVRAVHPPKHEVHVGLGETEID